MADDNKTISTYELGDTVRIEWVDGDCSEYNARVFDFANRRVTVVFNDTPGVMYTFHQKDSQGTAFRDVCGRSVFIEKMLLTGAP